MKTENLETLSAAALAYLGDTVWEREVRRYLVIAGVQQPSEKSLAFVTAAAQSDALERLLPHLTEAETEVFKRGRNTVHGNVPRAATVAQYRRATGLETLFGYLDLAGEQARIAELFALAFPPQEDADTDAKEVTP